MGNSYNISAIDIGSNTIHQVIANVDHSGHLQIIDGYKENTRLIDYLTPEKELPQEAFDECLKTLLTMLDLAKHYAAKIRAVATQATREAKNYREFIDFLYINTGITVEIIDGFEEARLSFLGMRQSLDLEKNQTLGVDIGGGSTEIVVATGNRHEFLTSFKLGSANLTKTYFDSSIPTSSSIKKLKNEIITMLSPIRIAAQKISLDMAVTTSGTAKALTQIHHYMQNSGAISDPNGYSFSQRDLKKMESQLIRIADPKKLAKTFHLDARRSQLIIAGTMILSTIGQMFSVKSWIYSSLGLREGLAIDTLARSGLLIEEKYKDIRWQSVIKFGEKFQVDESYATHITTLATSILDQISHIFPQKIAPFRYFLKTASFLLETGKFISFSRFHKHSYYVIAKGGMLGFSQYEKELIALIARYSKKGMPDKSKKKKNMIFQNYYKEIQLLSCCLQIACALNRTRRQKIEKIEIKDLGSTMNFFLFPHKNIDSDLEFEMQTMEENKKIIEKIFRRNINFSCPKH